MNLVFIGSSTFGLRCLETCLGLSDVKVVGVVTAPRTFPISYRPEGVANVLHAAVADVAKSHGVAVRTLQRAMNEPELIDAVTQWKPAAFLVAGWYHMIPRRWRRLAPAYGLHASLLPDYSGGAPLVWAMINGESKTGITLFQMDDGVDSGPIAGQREEPILPDDTIATLYERIEGRGLELVREAIPQMITGTLQLYPQDESKRRIFPQRGPEDGLIDWYQDASTVARFIRAQTRPYPGAFSTLSARPLHIWHTHPRFDNQDGREPGRIHRTDGANYVVDCGTGAIVLGEITYDQRTYTQGQLADLFGGGGTGWARRRAA
jgi:methionyl-tRNA formyltransferase